MAMDKRFVLAVAADDRLWSTKEIVGILLGMRQSLAAAPWFVRFSMRQWNAAIDAAISVFATSALISAEKDAQDLVDDLSNSWENVE